VSLLRIVLSH